MIFLGGDILLGSLISLRQISVQWLYNIIKSVSNILSDSKIVRFINLC